MPYLRTSCSALVTDSDWQATTKALDRASNIMGLIFFGLGRRAGGHRRGARLLTGPAGPMGAHGPHFYGQPGLWMRKQLNNDVYGKKDLELSWNWNCPETLSLKQKKGDAIGAASEP
ncbi:unnamed protein product [Effrenium voratum]|nr:unnamed protein product [Effrenium voratum]